jgi:hypothetical protein
MIRTAILPAVVLASALAFPITGYAAMQMKPVAHKIDVYAAPDLSAHTDNLDNWAIELQNDPTSRGYVIAYGGRKSRPGDALKAANNQLDYAVNVRGIDSSRLSAMNGGYRDVPTIELWILRNGAPPPAPTPTIRRKQ